MRTNGQENISFLQGLKNRLSFSNIDWDRIKRVFTKSQPVETLAAGRKNYRSATALDATKKEFIIQDITVRPVQRQSQDIQKWRNALIQAEGDYDQRTQLLDLYAEVLLDGHLKDAIRKRVNAVINLPLTFTVNGKDVPEVVELTEKSFFEDLLVYVMESKFFGHSLIELQWSKEGGATKLIPRKHVKPRLGIVTREQYDTTGILYREQPFIYNLIEAGKSDDLGALLEAAQYVIYKRGDFGDWAEFAEVFGMPFRSASYNNEQTRAILEQALRDMGSAGFIVHPSDAEINLQYPTGRGAGSDIFERLWKACNQEISVTIVGNTETTLSSTSSGYAQSKTHQEVQEALHKADRRFLLRILNEKLVPYLERVGFKVKGGKFSFVDEETLTLTERLNIDLKVAEKVPVGNSYWYEKYKIPMPKANDLPDPDPEEDEDDDPQPGASKKKASG